jgi:simple sugar transport system substrate-binding protein/ribose transport system substrate-binding protein
MKRRTLSTATALAGIVALLAGCGSSSTKSTGGGAAGSSVVGVDYPRSDSDFWNSYIKYVPQYGSQYKLDLKTSNSENDIAKLTANVQALTGQGVKGVVMAPQDTAAIAPTLDQLKAKNPGRDRGHPARQG